MTRIALTDGTGRWFDIDKATEFTEETYWDGSNNISKNTGSQWYKETLYRTVGGKWILNEEHGHITHAYEIIGNHAAAAWLVLNEYEPHESCIKEFSELEIK